MEIEYCKFLGDVKYGNVVMKPLGVARNNIEQPTLTGWKDIVTEIIIDKNYTKGLDGIEKYSHVIVVYWMNKEEECHLKHHPQDRADVPFVGIFACRCPQRPNPIAMSTVELLERRDNVIKVKGLDILNGTPILDVKPYTPQYDFVEEFNIPEWVNNLKF